MSLSVVFNNKEDVEKENNDNVKGGIFKFPRLPFLVVARFVARVIVFILFSGK
jgi:hypothetical protein|tara:strand:+ start:901 stop:1059 length:159 start_codon:yes stop_codon:yes gene_type:complete